MNRLIFALALVPAFLATGAQAQTVGEDVSKQLWCGQALSYLYGSISSVPPDQQPMLDAVLVGVGKMVDAAAQSYLDAGFTEEAVTKIKADLTTEVTAVISQQAQGKYGQDECMALMRPFVVLPAEPSSAPSAPDASSASAPAESSTPPGASSSSAQ